MAKDKPLRRFGEGITLFVATLSLIATVVAHGFASLTLGNGHLGFANRSSAILDRYYTEISPAIWLSGGWAIAYCWQLLWLVYGWSFLFRPQATRTIPTGSYWFFDLSCLLTISWLLLTGNHYLVGALPFVVLIPISLILAQSLVVWNTYRNTLVLQASNSVDLWATRVLVHNGFAFIIAWFSVQWILHAVMTATEYGLDTSLAASLGLAVLCLQLTVWFALEHSVLDRFVRYIHIEYLVVMAMLAAIVFKHWNNKDEELINSVFAVALLGFTFVLQLCRVILVVLYCRFKSIEFPSLSDG